MKLQSKQKSVQSHVNSRQGEKYPMMTRSSIITTTKRLRRRRRQRSLEYAYIQITALVGLMAHARAENNIVLLKLALNNSERSGRMTKLKDMDVPEARCFGTRVPRVVSKCDSGQGGLQGV
jgi:hypothetical protein